MDLTPKQTNLYIIVNHFLCRFKGNEFKDINAFKIENVVYISIDDAIIIAQANRRDWNAVLDNISLEFRVLYMSFLKDLALNRLAEHIDEWKSGAFSQSSNLLGRKKEMEYVDYLLLSVAIGTTGWLCFLWTLGKLRIQKELTEIAEQRDSNRETFLLKEEDKNWILKNRYDALLDILSDVVKEAIEENNSFNKDE